MRPHITPKVILKQFRIGSGDDSPVLVMDKSTKVFRERGINHSVFLGPSNYLGNGDRGTLENEMACKDESSIIRIIEMVRNGFDMTESLPELKFLLGNNAARNPHFRKHPKVTEYQPLSSESFHTVAMDIFPDQYTEYPISIIRIKSNSNSLLLPYFSLTHMVLSPDIAIIRFTKDDQTELEKMAEEDESHFVTRLNQLSYEKSHSWVVSNSRQLLESLGGIAKKNCSK
jgi:hypothetical protein